MGRALREEEKRVLVAVFKRVVLALEVTDEVDQEDDDEVESGEEDGANDDNIDEHDADDDDLNEDDKNNGGISSERLLKRQRM